MGEAKGHQARGLRNALEEHGLPTDGPLLFRGNPIDPGFVRDVMRERPDGIAFIHDDMAIDFMGTYFRRYRRKIRYIGLDDIWS